MHIGERNVKAGIIVLLRSGNDLAQEDLIKILATGGHVDVDKGGDRKGCRLHGLDLDPLVPMPAIRNGVVVWILCSERLFADNDQGVEKGKGVGIFLQKILAESGCRRQRPSQGLLRLLGLLFLLFLPLLSVRYAKLVSQIFHGWQKLFLGKVQASRHGPQHSNGFSFVRCRPVRSVAERFANAGTVRVLVVNAVVKIMSPGGVAGW